MNDHLPVAKHVAIFWKPIRLPLEWAMNSEAVPVWDASRNYPVWHWLPDDVISIDPSKREAWVKQWMGKKWQLLSPPSPPHGFPRLVRAIGEWLPTQPIDDEEMLSRLSRLARCLKKDPDLERWLILKGDLPKQYLKPSNRLLKEVFGLALDYGSTLNSGDDLRNWLTAAYEVAYHAWVLNELKDAKEEKEDALIVLRDDEMHPFAFNKWIAQEAQEAKNVADFRGKTATGLWKLVFEDDAAYWRKVAIEGYVETQIPTVEPLVLDARIALKLNAGCLSYARYLLGLRYMEGTHVEICDGCGSLFFPSRTDGKTCPGSSTCRSRKSRKKV